MLAGRTDITFMLDRGRQECGKPTGITPWEWLKGEEPTDKVRPEGGGILMVNGSVIKRGFCDTVCYSDVQTTKTEIDGRIDPSLQIFHFWMGMKTGTAGVSHAVVTFRSLHVRE